MVIRLRPVSFWKVAALFGLSSLFLLAIIKLFGTAVSGHPTGPAPDWEAANELAVSTTPEPVRTADIPEFAADEPSLRLVPRLSHAEVSAGDPTDLYGVLTVQARPRSEDSERAPLNLAVVIDRSTSMAGGKLQEAKLAADTLIANLGPQDRLAVVSYGSDVRVHTESLVATERNVDRLHTAVSSIQLGGGTNLSSGYETGRDLVLARKSERSINRVLLLSDGNANEGITEPYSLEQLAASGMERGVTLTTMGLGLDYNEDLMNAMATHGAGNYYFIENGARLGAIFEREFDGLSSAVARNARLVLTPQPGVQLVDLHGFASHSDGTRTIVELGPIFAGQQIDLVFEARVSPRSAGEESRIVADLTFTDVARSDEPAQVAHTLRTVAVDGAVDSDALDADVLRRVQQIKTADALKTAMRDYQRGQRSAAAERLEGQRDSNRIFVRKYGFESDAAFERVDEELTDLAEQVRSYRPHSSKGKFLGKKAKFRSANIVKSEVSF